MDQAQVDDLTKQLFEAISFAEGTDPSIGQIQDLFVEEGILIDNNPPSRLFSVPEFINFFRSQVSEGTLPSLYETEVRSSTLFYGNLAHRASHYEARFKVSDPKPFTVGVNSIQFVKREGEWRISSMAWNEVNQ